MRKSVPEPTYKHKGVQKLHELYLEYKEKLSGGSKLSMASLLWRSIAPEIPNLLAHLDENDEMRKTIGEVVAKVAEAFREDAT